LSGRLIEVAHDIGGHGSSADRCIRRRGIVIEIERLGIGERAKLEEIVRGEIRADCRVVNVSDVQVIENVIRILESNVARFENAVEQRSEFIVEGLKLLLHGEEFGRVVVGL